jgi:hypothetical protein
MWWVRSSVGVRRVIQVPFVGTFGRSGMAADVPDASPVNLEAPASALLDGAKVELGGIEPPSISR